MSVAEAPARTLPRAALGQQVLFNAGNSPFWHPAIVTMVSQHGSDIELAVVTVHGRDKGDMGGTHVTFQLKTPCFYHEDPRIGSDHWDWIVEDQSGGMWKFNENEASYVDEINELKDLLLDMHRRLDRCDKALLDFGHSDTLGNQPGEPPKKKRRGRPDKTPSEDDELDSASED